MKNLFSHIQESCLVIDKAIAKKKKLSRKEVESLWVEDQLDCIALNEESNLVFDFSN